MKSVVRKVKLKMKIEIERKPDVSFHFNPVTPRIPTLEQANQKRILPCETSEPNAV